MTDLPPRFVAGSTGLSTLQENRINGTVYEWVVHCRLAGAGYEVTNLNDEVENFPVADLVASNGRHRLLVQVRGATADSGKFRTEEAEVQRLDRLASALGHRGLYAFVFHQVGINFRTTAEMLRGQSGRCEYLDCEDPYLFGERLADRLDEILVPDRSRVGIRAPSHGCVHERTP